MAFSTSHSRNIWSDLCKCLDIARIQRKIRAVIFRTNTGQRCKKSGDPESRPPDGEPVKSHTGDSERSSRRFHSPVRGVPRCRWQRADENRKQLVSQSARFALAGDAEPE